MYEDRYTKNWIIHKITDMELVSHCECCKSIRAL
jgi:hypothetical protein